MKNKRNRIHFGNFNMDRRTFITVTSVAAAFVVVFAVIITVIALKVSRDSDAPSQLDGSEVSGVWIATVSNIDFPSAADLSADELCAELDSIVETAAEADINAIYFQVRPSSDALYKSEIFPVSRFMSSDGTLTLDALDYLIEAAHKKGIAVHAWVNPLRVTTGSAQTLEALPDGCPAKENPGWTVSYDDGRIYYNCGIPEVRQLVADGVREIVEGYDVDGIIFDDYFYPYPRYITGEDGSSSLAVFDDGDSFSEYGGDFDDIGDWRRDNVNRMVELVYNTVKDARGDCEFGVAPFGIWKNGYGDESGSETRGSQSYYDIYCDTVAWVRGGYVDYIAPQLYWRSDESAAPYDVLCTWWDSVVSDTDVRLLISHAAYRYDGDWSEPAGTVSEQVAAARQLGSYRGSIYYGYDEIHRNLSGIADEIRELNEEYKAKESE